MTIRQFGLRDVLIVTACFAVLAALVTPLILRAREASRAMNCSLKLQQQLMALHNYEAAYKRFPNPMGGSSGSDELTSNMSRLSGFVALLGFLEDDTIYRQIADGVSKDGVSYPSFGPAPWIEQFSPWRENQPSLRCPSAPALDFAIPVKNYAFCIGDAARQVHNMKQPFGVFAPGFYRKITDIADGTANTIAICEIGTKIGVLNQGQCAIEQSAAWLEQPSLALAVSKNGKYLAGVKLSKLGRGANWVDGAGMFGLVNTILPPNGPTVVLGKGELADGFYSAGSYHRGGVNIAFADGSVRFVAESIDTGDLSKPVLSAPNKINVIEGVYQGNQYGVWGTLGSADSGEGLFLD